MDTQLEALRSYIDIGFAEINMRIVDARREVCARLDESRATLDARISELRRETCDHLRLIEEKLYTCCPASGPLIQEMLRAAVGRIDQQQKELLGHLKQIEARFSQTPLDQPR